MASLIALRAAGFDDAPMFCTLACVCVVSSAAIALEPDVEGEVRKKHRWLSRRGFYAVHALLHILPLAVVRVPRTARAQRRSARAAGAALAALAMVVRPSNAYPYIPSHRARAYTLLYAATAVLLHGVPLARAADGPHGAKLGRVGARQRGVV